ncbi:response regulator transcription factor [Wansuia hejianensis]|uniref:Stage 0 sporulation protein A homolog n=1 Tax=Wansuia hejianensis TaxID=2763667 RepID=A0A926EXX8_9FIRM|nr:response regulator transcription factor [Wansuia hejianensis]MBC8590393.1 response regulator transcription factor [Wansuia hejianensis]
MTKIYCVEDDDNIRELIVYALNNSGFDAMGFENAANFYLELDKSTPDLILLDIMLPDEDGLSILKNIRQNPKTMSMPVIMLTAKSSEYDRVIGLDTGADDYIIKPFSVMELISRIKALLRRVNIGSSNNIISFKNIVLNYDKRLVTVDNSVIYLTYKEFELLYYLLKNQNIVLSREKVLNEVWGYDFEGETRTVDVHIGTLRQKLGESGIFIQTIRNVGYKIGERL